jgi:hypothetical protein
MNLTTPTEVAAVQVTTEDPTVKVTWKPAGLAAYYFVYRFVYRSEQADGGFEYAGISDGRIFDANGNCFYLDTDVEPPHTYYYKIRAGSEQAHVNSSDFSNVSNGVSVS